MDIEYKLKLAEHKQDCMQKRAEAEQSLTLVEAEDKRLRSIVLRLTGAVELIEVLEQEVVLSMPENQVIVPEDPIPEKAPKVEQIVRQMPTIVEPETEEPAELDDWVEAEEPEGSELGPSENKEN